MGDGELWRGGCRLWKGAYLFDVLLRGALYGLWRLHVLLDPVAEEADHVDEEVAERSGMDGRRTDWWSGGFVCQGGLD